MHAQIHGDKDNAGNGGCGVTMPAVEQDSDVVIPVQKHQFLLVNDNKESIQQFGKFANGKQKDPQSRRSASHRRTGGDTKVVLKGHVDKIVEQMRKASEKSPRRKGAQ